MARKYQVDYVLSSTLRANKCKPRTDNQYKSSFSSSRLFFHTFSIHNSNTDNTCHDYHIRDTTCVTILFTQIRQLILRLYYIAYYTSCTHYPYLFTILTSLVSSPSYYSYYFHNSYNFCHSYSFHYFNYFNSFNYSYK